MFARILVALALFVLGPAGGHAHGDYVVGVVPRVPPEQAQRDWKPLLARLASDAGVGLTLRLYERRADFEADFSRGQPDFAFLSPFHLVMARRAQGYMPLVRGTAKPLQGLLVVRADSKIRTVQDLDGAEIAFPSPNAFAASLYLRALLAEQEKIAVRPVYVNSHSNAFRSVIFGRAPAGGGANDVFDAEPEEVRRQLRVIFATPATKQHSFAAHPRLPEETRAAVARALLDLQRSEDGRRLLEQTNLAKPVAADYRRDYQALERLGLDKYLVVER